MWLFIQQCNGIYVNIKQVEGVRKQGAKEDIWA